MNTDDELDKKKFSKDKFELYQKLTDVCFENGGVTKPMVDKLVAIVEAYTEGQTNFWYEGIKYKDPKSINFICDLYLERMVELGKYIPVEKARRDTESQVREALDKELTTVLRLTETPKFDTPAHALPIHTVKAWCKDRLAQLKGDK
jgi:hypothetical protein